MLYNATMTANIPVSIKMADHQQIPSTRPRRSIQLGSGLQRFVSFSAPQATGNTMQDRTMVGHRVGPEPLTVRNRLSMPTWNATAQKATIPG